MGRSRGTTEQLAAMCGTQLLCVASLENVNVLPLVTFTGWLRSFKDFGFQAATFEYLCWEPFITSLILGRPLSAHYSTTPASISCHNSHICMRWLSGSSATSLALALLHMFHKGSLCCFQVQGPTLMMLSGFQNTSLKFL